MIWRCLPPYGHGTAAPGTVTSWVAWKLAAKSINCCSDSPSPESASCRIGTLEAL